MSSDESVPSDIRNEHVERGNYGESAPVCSVPEWDPILFDIPFLADWKKIGEHRQRQTDRNTARENKSRIDWDYKVGDKVLVRKEGILRKSESKYHRKPWTISRVHTNGTLRIHRGIKSERLNIRRVTPYFV